MIQIILSKKSSILKIIYYKLNKITIKTKIKMMKSKMDFGRLFQIGQLAQYHVVVVIKHCKENALLQKMEVKIVKEMI